WGETCLGSRTCEIRSKLPSSSRGEPSVFSRVAFTFKYAGMVSSFSTSPRITTRPGREIAFMDVMRTFGESTSCEPQFCDVLRPITSQRKYFTDNTCGGTAGNAGF